MRNYRIGLDLSSVANVHESFNAALLQYELVDKLYCSRSHLKCLLKFDSINQDDIFSIPDWVLRIRLVRTFIVLLIVVIHFRSRFYFFSIEVENFFPLALFGFLGCDVTFFSHSLPLRYKYSKKTRLFLNASGFLFIPKLKARTVCVVHKSSALESEFVRDFVSRFARIVVLPHPVVSIYQDTNKYQRYRPKRNVRFLGANRRGKGYACFNHFANNCKERVFTAVNTVNCVPFDGSCISDNISFQSSSLAFSVFLCPSDVVFNCYDEDWYAFVPSGIFFDAIASGSWILQRSGQNIELDQRKFFYILRYGENFELLKQRSNIPFNKYVRDQYLNSILV